MWIMFINFILRIKLIKNEWQTFMHQGLRYGCRLIIKISFAFVRKAFINKK